MANYPRKYRGLCYFIGVLIWVCRPCPSVVGLTKPFVLWGLLVRWTATLSKSVSNGADGKTIRHYWLELAETRPDAGSQMQGPVHALV